MKNRIIALVVGMMLLMFSFLTAQITFERWYGGGAEDHGYSIIQTLDGGYLATGMTLSSGAGYEDAYLVKINSFGDSIWAKTYGGTAVDWANSVANTSDSCYIITGETHSFGAGWFDVYLIKTDLNGDSIWTKTYGFSFIDYGYSVCETSDNSFIVAGCSHVLGSGCDVYLIKTNQDGDTLWTKTYNVAHTCMGYSVVQTHDGGYVIAGVIEPSAQTENVLLIKTDTDGNISWWRSYGGSSDDRGYSVCQTSDSGYIIGGETYSYGAGSNDIYVIKTNAIGDTVWTRTYGGSNSDRGSCISTCSTGGYIIVGTTFSYGSGSDDVYIVRINESGDTLWTRTYGGSDRDEGFSISETSDGGFIATGAVSGFGRVYDVYFLKIDSLGNVGIQEFNDPRPVTRSIRLLCHPNPFTTTTMISIEGLKKDAQPTLSIYDSSGRRVREISLLPFSFYLGATWDGRNDVGKVLPSGIYFLKLNGKPVGKVVKVR